MNAKNIHHINTATDVNHTAMRRDLFLTILAGTAFIMAPQLSDGWFLVVVTYVLACASLFHCIRSYSAKPVANWVFWGVNLLGCSGLTAALLFSGRGAVLF